MGIYVALISFRLSTQLLAELDELVRQGTYDSRADAIRKALQTLLLIENLAIEGTTSLNQLTTAQGS